MTVQEQCKKETQQDFENMGGVVIPDGAVCYCSWCEVFFRSWKKLDCHLMQEHRGKKKRRAFKCRHCWAGFKHFKSLEKHVSTGKHSFPYRVSKVSISAEEGDEVIEVLHVPDGFQATSTVSLRDGVLAD